MRILFLSCYSSEYFENLIENEVPISIAIQKFSRLYIEGFVNNNIDVDVIIPSYPCSITGKLFSRGITIEENSVCYHYMPRLRIRKLNGLLSLIYTKKFTKNWIKKHSDGVVVIDYLRQRALSISRVCAKYNVKNVCIVTDRYEVNNFDNFLSKLKKCISIIKSKVIFRNSTHFVFLTKYMNDDINKWKKPYIINEGLVDIKTKPCSNLQKVESNKKRICLYSGKVNKSNGIPMLVEAFINASISDCELHIYGSGEYSKELEGIALRYTNIKFFGVVNNDIVVKAQNNATLLVNPRPSNQEYTKYSFPSKNIEYMASGTACLFTKLCCIPNDYYDKVFFVDEETIKGFSDKLIEIFNMDESVVKSLGIKAQKFVMKEKNNHLQAKKVIELLDKKYCEKAETNE